MSTTHTAVFENAILKSTELKADTKIAVGLDTEQTTKELTVVGDAPEIRIQDKTGSNPEVNQTTLSIVADGGVTHFRAGTSTFDTTETKGDIKFQSSTGDSTHAIITGTGRVGVGTTAPTESLDIVGNINLQKVSNTATIKLDSNVVTEYVRSKKLIKYPRVAMTGATTGGYTASATSVLGDDYTNYAPWKAFDTTIDGNVGWAVGNLYDSSTGEATSSATLFNNRRGEYIDLQLPDAINVLHFIIKTRETGTYIPEDSPGEGYLYGSNDGSNWSELTFFSGLTYGGMTINGNTYEQVQVNATGFYNYLRLQVTKRAGQSSTDQFMAIGELEYYGIPEYDPEAHGTDTIMRSVPNVPNTDWLEVYYDGQDYTSMPATVTDKSGNGLTGTPNGGVTFDSTWKAFSFDGVDDYIQLNTNLDSGNITITVSAWIRCNEYDKWLMWLGADIGSTGEGLGIFRLENEYKMNVRGGNLVTLSAGALNTWEHILFIYHGTGSTKDAGTIEGYINGVSGMVTSFNLNDDQLNISANPNLEVGARSTASSGNYFKGSIANFRLFNRALTTDEIWHLYAYQKEYFQVSPDVLTFKGGRLGIGTSNPQATLDVHGTLKAHSLTLTNNTPPIFKMSLQTTQSNQNDTTTFTKRSLFSLTNGAVLRINNGGAVSLAYTDSYLTINYSGYYRITGNILYQAFVDRVAIAVQPAINDVPTGEIFINNYIRNVSLNTRSGTSFSTIYYFNKDDSLSFLFAKYGADDGGATMVGDASFIILEKL